jgi:hypothetical protein
MSEQHEGFKKRFFASLHSVFVAGEMLSKAGFDVEIRALRAAPTAADAPDYVDNGDIFATKDGRRTRHEVHHYSGKFTGAEDYPYQHLLVGSKAAVDRANGTVASWIILDEDYENAAIVFFKTHDYWYEVDIHARNTGNIEKKYACPKELAAWRKVSP